MPIDIASVKLYNAPSVDESTTGNRAHLAPTAARLCLAKQVYGLVISPQ
jgi:hypothetical protein